MSAKRHLDARGSAALALVEILERKSSESQGLRHLERLKDRDRAFSRHLVFGVLRWLGALRWLSGQLLHRPLKARDKDVEYLVLLGLFQLWKGGTPPHAAIHETAGAARQLGKAWAAGVINAVLRNFQRSGDALLNTLAEQPERHAHPEWLLGALQADWPDAWESIVDENNKQPPMWLRVNARRCTRTQYLDRLSKAGLAGQPAQELAEALLCEPPVPVEKLPGFSDGLVSVQDAAAQWAAALIDARPGQRVLDACAAPGGKTCHLLERTPGIELLALDREPPRVALIEENLGRLGLEAHTLNADAGAPSDWWDGTAFDRVLLDAPCSATGVIRRHPEIKWLRSPAQVESAVSEQARLLDALWPLLKPGGMLVYATCSVLKCENSLQIGQFLDRHADSAAAPMDGFDIADGEPGRQILPGERNMDGFYYARLVKFA